MAVDRDEFKEWMQLLREDIQGVNTRLDVLNGRTRAAETKIAVLEDRGDATARYIGMGVGLVGATIELGKWLFGHK